jgi:hypothetical protein
MKFSIERHDYDDTLRVVLVLEGSREIKPMNLTHFDRVLIHDCEDSDKASDKLLALETIVRRIEEATAAADSRTTQEK